MTTAHEEKPDRDPPGTGAVAALGVAPSTNVETLLAQLSSLIDPDVALLVVLDADAERPAVLHAWSVRAPALDLAQPAEAGFLAAARAQRRTLLRRLDPDRDSELIRAAGSPITHAASAAIRGPDRELSGHLIAGFTVAPANPRAALWALRSAASLLSVCLQLPGALERFVSSPRIDALTGCVTYEHTLHELKREVNRSARAGTPLCCCFIDLDGFKLINDEYGHLRGNEALAAVSRVLRAAVRSFDTVGRYGGDEFVVILPNTAEPLARAIAERLRRRLSRASITPLDLRLTASIGVAEWKPGTTPEQLLADADDALLRAKMTSPPRVIAADDSQPHAAAIG